MKPIRGIHYFENDNYDGHKHVPLGETTNSFLAALVLKSPRAGARLHVGCREFTREQAMKWWRGGKTAARFDACDCEDCQRQIRTNGEFDRPHHIALVKYAAAIAKTNGWKF